MVVGGYIDDPDYGQYFSSNVELVSPVFNNVCAKQIKSVSAGEYIYILILSKNNCHDNCRLSSVMTMSRYCHNIFMTLSPQCCDTGISTGEPFTIEEEYYDYKLGETEYSQFDAWGMTGQFVNEAAIGKVYVI